jgi:hypothetical protein
MTQPSDRYRLIEAALGVPLLEFVRERRAVDGPPFKPPTSWRDLAREITDRTDISINAESLRLWFTAQPTAEPAGGAR